MRNTNSWNSRKMPTMGSMAMAISFIYNGSSCIKAVPMPVVLSKCTGVMAAASPLPLLKKPSSSTDRMGPIEHRATRPKLSAADELTGLIGAAALMRPSKSVQDMELKSIKKKFKDKKFAAGCSRDVIITGAERLGWELDVLMEKTLEAMRSCEAFVAEELAKA